MPNRSHTTRPTEAGIDPAVLRATEHGTAQFRDRFAARYTTDFFRPTTFGLTVSSIGIGTYLGDSTDEVDRSYEAAIRYAVERGVNLIDTAINYRCQRSERAVGSAIQHLIAEGKARRDELVVCTKGGYVPLDREAPPTREEYQRYLEREFFEPEILHPDDLVAGGHSLAPRFLRYCLAKSRQNLGLRTVDVYYVHNPGQQLTSVSRGDWRNRIVAAFGILEEAAHRGEIGVYGVATWDELRTPPAERGHVELEELVELATEAGGASHRMRVVQAPVNLAMPEAVRTASQTVGGAPRTLMDAANELGLTVLGSATLMQSRLASGLPEAVQAHFPGLATDAQRAVAFARAIDGMACSLVGMKDVRHVEENLGGAAQ